MDRIGRVVHEQEGWYLVCGEERRGPYAGEPSLLPAPLPSTDTTTGFAGSDGTVIETRLEEWDTAAGRVLLARQRTDTIDTEPRVRQYFLDAG